MRIANKITILILFFWCILAVNTFIALKQINRVEVELKNVAGNVIQLNEVITTIAQLQLEKTILIERVLNISEEIGFQDVSPSRQQHLMDYANITKKGFDQLAQQGAMEIIHGKEIIQKNLSRRNPGEVKDKWHQTNEKLLQIEQSHIRYDGLVDKIFGLINAGQYELSLEDIKRIQIGHRTLSKNLHDLLDEVQGFVRVSIEYVSYYEKVSRRMLWMSLVLSIVGGLIIALSIIKRISEPLRELGEAATRIGDGQYIVHLDGSSRDEIGDVSKAFTLMSKKLMEAKLELEKKNQELSISLDITNSQKRDLQKINHELDRFVYTVSHDIRAPLTGIMGYSAYLEEKIGAQLDERQKRSLMGIKRGTERLNAMINDLLELTRISRINNPYEETDMNAVMQDICDRLEYRIKEAKVELIVPESLPTIICDRIKMSEVFLNLINNAIKFSSKNNMAQARVEMGYVDTADAHEFFVKDNGIGIALENHAKVFEIFQRLDTTNEYEGTGAGLSIVKSVVDDHGGKIWIESDLGQGATFFLTIPKGLKIKQS